MDVLVQRIVMEYDEGDATELGFDVVEQKIDVLRDVAADVTPEQAVEMAYESAHMSPRDGKHVVTQLGNSVEVERNS